MKFSILLPTRNGVNYLENCILSVLEQNFDDMELVISDNANTDGSDLIIKKFIVDKRVVYVRQDKLLSVSDNWTAAVKKSSGDYILMLGDDDYLLSGTINILNRLIDFYNLPDCILYNGFSFIAPLSIANNESSYYNNCHFNYKDDFTKESILNRKFRFNIVKSMFEFDQRVPLNMQTILFSRKSYDQINKGVFKLPFPDHYLINALLLNVDKFIYTPEKLIIVGVSPKSFGSSFYSQKSKVGLNYLGVEINFKGALEGNVLINGMVIWLLNLKEEFPHLLKSVEINWSSYIRRQFYFYIIEYKYSKKLIIFYNRVKKMRLKHWALLAQTTFDLKSWKYLFSLSNGVKKSKAENLWKGLEPIAKIKNIREFSNWLSEKKENQ